MRIYSYDKRGGDPRDVTDNDDSPRKVILFNAHQWWHGPMACDPCELLLSAVMPVADAAEAAAINAADEIDGPHPETLNGERCPTCGSNTLRHHPIEGWG